VQLARALAAAGGVHAAIDLSDGLASDLGHLCEAGRVGARIDGAASESMLDPGDDYELLLAIEPGALPESRRIAGARDTSFTRIGEVIEGPGVWRRQADGQDHPVEPRGWDHFAPDVNS
jgi:thiamine-monophosphate kinase